MRAQKKAPPRPRELARLKASSGESILETKVGDGWEIRLADCLGPHGLGTIDAVDHVVTDPPYEAFIYKNMRTNAGHGRRKDGTPYSNRKALETSNALAALRIGEIDRILPECATHFARICQRWCLVFSNDEATHVWRELLTKGGLEYIRTGVWVKTDPMPQISADRPGQGHETYTLCHPKGKKRWNGGGRSADYKCGTAKGRHRPDHPCPKPLRLMEQIVLDYTQPGDLVCDPFSGSGTTAVACVKLGRRFIGWEIDRTFWKDSVDLLKSVGAVRVGQTSLFAGADES